MSLGFTWRHSVSLGVTLAPLGFTWFHLVSLGVTWCHLVSLGFTWCHLVSLGVTWCHLVSLGFTLPSLGFTWYHSVSLGVTRFRRNQVVVDSQFRSRMTRVHSGVLCWADGVFFLPCGEKKDHLVLLGYIFLPKNRISRKLQLKPF